MHLLLDRGKEAVEVEIEPCRLIRKYVNCHECVDAADSPFARRLKNKTNWR